MWRAVCARLHLSLSLSLSLVGAAGAELLLDAHDPLEVPLVTLAQLVQPVLRR